MIVRVFRYVFLIAMFAPCALQAQMYAGVNKVLFASTGVESQTQWESDHLVARYEVAKQKISWVMKTQALTLAAQTSQQSLLQEVLQVNSNPLIQLEMDMAWLEGGNQSLQWEETTIPVKVFYNGQQAQAIATSSGRTEGKVIRLNWELTVPLSDLGLIVEGQHANVMGNTLTISVPEAKLERRW